jgi:hypothetical protein
MHRLAWIAVATLIATPPVFAQPAGGEIDMDAAPQAPAQPAPPSQPPKDDAPPAQPPADAAPVKDPKVAKKWLDAANTLVKQGDKLTKQGKVDEAKTIYANAAVAYGKAIESSDDVAIQLSLANALDKSGDVVGAMKACKVVLAAQGAKPDVTKKAQTKLDELTGKIGVVTLAITPEGTAISMGGTQIGEAPLAEPLVLPPGTHVLTLTAVGYQPKDIELKIEAGSESERKVDLEPIPMVTKPAEPEIIPEKTAGPTGPSRLPLYVGGGATVGLVLVATITGIIAIGYHSNYEQSVLPQERADNRSSGKAFALTTDIALLGAVGAAAFTTYWYMVKYQPQAHAMAERQAVGPKVDVLPWVQSDAGGLTAVGSF